MINRNFFCVYKKKIFDIKFFFSVIRSIFFLGCSPRSVKGHPRVKHSVFYKPRDAAFNTAHAVRHNGAFEISPGALA